MLYCDDYAFALDHATKERLLVHVKSRGVTRYYLDCMREYLRHPDDVACQLPAHYYLWAAGSLSDFPYTQSQLDKCARVSPGTAIAHAAHLIAPKLLQWCKDNQHHIP